MFLRATLWNTLRPKFGLCCCEDFLSVHFGNYYRFICGVLGVMNRYGGENMKGSRFIGVWCYLTVAVVLLLGLSGDGEPAGQDQRSQSSGDVMEEKQPTMLTPRHFSPPVYMYKNYGRAPRNVRSYQLALEAIRDSEYDDALDYLDSAMSEREDTAAICRARGMLAQFTGRYWDAMDWYDSARVYDPDDKCFSLLKQLAFEFTSERIDPDLIPLLTGSEAPELRDPLLAKQLDSIAVVCINKWQHVEAELYYLLAYDLRKHVLGKHHADLVISLNNLGEIAYLQQRYDEAKDWYYQAIVLLENTVGADHPDVADMLNNIGVIYFDRGLYPEAEPLFRRALYIRERVLGSENREVGEALVHLGQVYRFMLQDAKAESLFTRAWAIYDTLGETEGEEVAVILYSLADMYRDMKRYEDAEPLILRAIEIIEAIDPGHPDLHRYFLVYNKILFETGRYDEETKSIFRRTIDAEDRREKMLKEH